MMLSRRTRSVRLSDVEVEKVTAVLARRGVLFSPSWPLACLDISSVDKTGSVGRVVVDDSKCSGA